ncbi:microsomal signal peptidase 25 kDa subunit-domain-containing protein [Coniella lustricola]|uniref:Signal peptidase complex subunit 2 n=1 Tax=Coniella lustricola TaxID=2025994 RepID=A0A2T3AAT3_9PEZI|nr:microsomal signal peptidase 25 kDa subunit-domain-containing protein [Coniella lustricola]
MAVSQEKITIYNLADLKNTSDDALPNYLNSLKFKQSHSLTDVRLGLGYSAFFVAAACFLWDYKFGFDNTKYYTAAAVVVYCLLNSALTLWIWLKEKGIVYVGTAPNGNTITISSSAKKNVPIYNLDITIAPKTGNPQSIKLARSFTEWFDEQGHFVANPFQTMLASNIPIVGQLDPKRADAGSAGPAAGSGDFTAEELSAMIAGDTTSAEAIGSAANKSAKRRKA